MNKFATLLLIISISILGTINSNAGSDLSQISIADTDSINNFSLFAFYDLRDRESFVQITNPDISARRLHIQIFNVGNLCNENNFFDEYTGNDTHIYNMRDIQTNDENPSGVQLPENAYGIIAISSVDQNNGFSRGPLFGNFRVLDNSGYEYRTNLIGLDEEENFDSNLVYFANFNQIGGVNLSDFVGMLLISLSGTVQEWDASNIINTFIVSDVDIIDNNEVLLSCRDVIFACIEPDNPLVDELFAINSENSNFMGTNGASVASFEYGINNTISNSKGSELLCPGNIIGQGILKLNIQGVATPETPNVVAFPAFIGLNNGNGRGSMDTLWEESNPFIPDFS